MKFSEAMRALEEGKKVRAKEDPPNHYIIKILEKILLRSNGKSYDKSSSPLGCLFLQEWEIYEEPERTLSFMEMVQGLKEGKSFHRLSASIAVGAYGNEDCLNKFFRSSDVMRLEDFEANDWVCVDG